MYVCLPSIQQTLHTRRQLHCQHVALLCCRTSVSISSTTRFCQQFECVTLNSEVAGCFHTPSQGVLTRRREYPRQADDEICRCWRITSSSTWSWRYTATHESTATDQRDVPWHCLQSNSTHEIITWSIKTRVAKWYKTLGCRKQVNAVLKLCARHARRCAGSWKSSQLRRNCLYIRPTKIALKRLATGEWSNEGRTRS